jgi:hypothetical protein
MSIYDVIDARVQEGRLFRLPNLLGLPRARQMYLAEDIAKLIYGPWSSTALRARCAALVQDLEHFEAGYEIAVAMDDPRNPYRSKPQAFLRQLHPGSEEVWEIRSTTMDPSLRLFGRFAAVDHLVVLNWEQRGILGTPESREWRDERVRCKTYWENLFHPYPPHPPYSGAGLHEYVSAHAISL